MKQSRRPESIYGSEPDPWLPDERARRAFGPDRGAGRAECADGDREIAEDRRAQESGNALGMTPDRLSSARVFGCCGSVKTASGGPCSTITP